MRTRISTPQAASRLSRRTTLKLGSVGLAAVVSLKAGSAAAYQADLPKPLAALVAGWEAVDADQIAETYAEDGIAEDVASGRVTVGREEIRAYLTTFFGAFTEPTYEIPTAFASGDHGAIAWNLSATYTGMVPGFPPGTGELVTVRGLALVELGEEQVLRSVDYYDVYGILVQLGVVPPPEGGATPAG